MMSNDKLLEFRDFLIANREIIEPRFIMDYISKDLNNLDEPLLLVDINNTKHVGCLIGWNRVFLGREANPQDEISNIFADWASVINSELISSYLNSNVWAKHPETNTLEHALKRIQRVLDGDDIIGHIKWEYKKECKKLNIKEEWDKY